MNEIKSYIQESIEILNQINLFSIFKAIKIIKNCRSKKGRIFFAGSGGGAGHASHATNDFRKICDIESYCITDNVSELTARINDDGWDSSYMKWLEVSNFSKKDILFVFSVGGGNIKKKVSINLVNAMKYAKKKQGKIISISGKISGYANKISDASILIPNINNDNITPHTESFQALIWHLIVSHKQLKIKKTKW
jgi:D-sedoheptulose 7-phosphate isomerase